MHKSPKDPDRVTSRWGKKPVFGWLGIASIVLLTFLPILLFKGAGFFLPKPSEVLEPTPVTLGRADGWNLTLTASNGEELRCFPDSAVFLNGWDCQGTRIMVHSLEAPEDAALAIRRIIRAGNLSDLPAGKVETQGNISIVTLSQEETAHISTTKATGHIIRGLMVTDPTDPEGQSLIITMDGPAPELEKFTAQILEGAAS